ncbi:uncharacterized protein CTRU02_203756 [Colletotrichum truncatum]|uniref:Uncharacterized protein n=1 Tax=Colletotrichum truncatum TaxID=5467 RepID=A0ACC3ZA38_COLTU|nr:uncharacterized protein CTRU02_04088 [Colletotrichum truncatum]KAF6796127.1 hypothetical protein CTRU02_04088 [Colletotrichum truncatum]
MAPNTWTEQAERDLIMALFFNNANNGPLPKLDYAKAHQIMTVLGYSFTKDALNQRWNKVILKGIRERLNTIATGNSTGPATASASPASRKRAAPASSGKKTSTARSAGRSNQVSVQMAQAATSHDDGGDDEEDLDTKPPAAKRVKTNVGLVAGLQGQNIDLTNDEAHTELCFYNPVQVKNEVKMEEGGCGNPINFPGFARERRLVAFPCL